MNPSSRTDGHGFFACVVEVHPRLELELLRWFATLTRIAGVRPADLIVSVAGGGTSRAIDYVRAEGATVLEIDRFDSRSPHCNKIAGALALASAAPRDGVVVLTDTDVVVLEDARLIDVPDDALALKTVDAPYPSLDVLMDVFDAAALPQPPIVALHYVPAERSFLSNGNGGVYVLQSTLLPRLAAEWARWARWLLDRAVLLKEWKVHVDQVAMAMALAAADIRPVPLDIRWNFPTHVPTWKEVDGRSPAIIHYHNHLDRRGFLRYVGVPSIDERISRANQAIDAVSGQSASYRLMWWLRVLRQFMSVAFFKLRNR